MGDQLRPLQNSCLHVLEKAVAIVVEQAAGTSLPLGSNDYWHPELPVASFVRITHMRQNTCIVWVEMLQFLLCQATKKTASEQPSGHTASVSWL